MSNSEIIALVEELEGRVKFTVVPRIDPLGEQPIESSPKVAARIAEWVSKRSAETVSASR